MDANSGRKLLRGVKILAALSDEELEALAGRVSWLQFTAGAPVISRLEATQSVFFLVTGTCRVTQTSANGRDVAIRSLAEGGHFGELAILAGAPRTVDVVAETGCQLAECTRDDFETLLDNNPAFARAVASSLARMVVSLTERVFELVALQVHVRLHAYLLRLAKSGTATHDGIVIEDLPTHEAIAVIIGSQREYVSREFGFLTDKGVVKQDKRRLLIRDIEALRAMVTQRAGVLISDIVDWHD